MVMSLALDGGWWMVDGGWWPLDDYDYANGEA